MARNFFRAIFEHGALNIRKALNEALDSLWEYGPDRDFAHRLYPEWNLLGDPELNLWTAVPKLMVVQHDSIIPTGFQTFGVKVEEEDGKPVKNALVCVMMANDTSLYKYRYTNEAGFVFFPIEPKYSGWLYITVTAQNHIPYEDSCFVDAILANATYPNQARHLVRLPNTRELNWSYCGNRSIFCQTAEENLIYPPLYVDRGKFPSIALTFEGFPWLTYTTGPSLFGAVKTDKTIPGNWEKFLISTGDEIGPPSLVLSQVVSTIPEEKEIGYLVYEVKSFPEGRNYIYFTAFDSLGPYYTAVLDTGDIPNGSAVYTPSIAITPGDYLHIAWCKEGRVWYKTTLEPVSPWTIRQGIPPVWSEKVPISTQDPLTEPASNPFVETDGEWVYLVWRGPNEDSIPNPNYGEIWQRRRRMDWPITRWTNPINKSKSPLRESNYPTMSTGKAVVWQELLPDSNFEIYANLPIPQETINISRTENHSFYPHANLLPAPPYIPFEWELFNIWTEEIIPETFYKVIFKPYYFQPRDISDPSLAILCGESIPSPYCLNRDGFINYGEITIDYSNPNLKYKLPYLHPKKYYLLEAVVYQETTGIHRERVEFEGGKGKNVEFYPEEPETLRVVIPSGTYDSTVTWVEIKNFSANFLLLLTYGYTSLRLWRKRWADPRIGG